MSANGLGSKRRVLALGFAILVGWSSATAEQETLFTMRESNPSLAPWAHSFPMDSGFMTYVAMCAN